MTGQGQASRRFGPIGIDVEIRTVNNRFLKVVYKISDAANSIEPQLEALIREHIKRGSVNVSIRLSHTDRSNAASIDAVTLQDYVKQATKIGKELDIVLTYSVGELLALPGVLIQNSNVADEELLSAVQQTVTDCLHDLQSMRQREGNSMADQLLAGLDAILEARKEIESRAPNVIAEYRHRLETRVRSALSDLGHPHQEVDVIREVLIHTDRCDIREELVRLASHVEQFRSAIQHPESQGRKLDFLIQELFRETNTIGSKANDAEISQRVVFIKATIEQMRELVQNVE